MDYEIVIQSQIPMGSMSETMHLFAIDRIANKCQMAKPLEFVDIGFHGSFDPSGTAFITADHVGYGSAAPAIRDFLQAMVDAAWKRGIKPSQMEKQTAELSAVTAHLDDMRMLVATKLDVPLMLKVGTRKSIEGEKNT
jgi:hypothetical protein